VPSVERQDPQRRALIARGIPVAEVMSSTTEIPPVLGLIRYVDAGGVVVVYIVTLQIVDPNGVIGGSDVTDVPRG
jgi:hypothetical protein